MPILQSRMLDLIKSGQDFFDTWKRVNDSIVYAGKRLAAGDNPERVVYALIAEANLIHPTPEAIAVFENEKAHFKYSATRNDTARRRLARRRGQGDPSDDALLKSHKGTRKHGNTGMVYPTDKEPAPNRMEEPEEDQHAINERIKKRSAASTELVDRFLAAGKRTKDEVLAHLAERLGLEEAQSLLDSLLDSGTQISMDNNIVSVTKMDFSKFMKGPGI